MVDYKELFNELKSIGSARVLRNESMSSHTSLRIGGPAKILIIPKDIEALQKAVSITRGTKTYVMGNGSNILVPDKGLNGVVIKIAGGMNSLESDGRSITVGGGTLMQPLIRKLAHLGLSGLEFAAGVPAAIGGAVVMNMGAFGQDTGSLVEQVEIIDRSGKRETLSRGDLEFSYRKSNIRDCVAAFIRMKMSYRQKEWIRKRIDETLRKRKELQPWAVPSAGSIFKNPKEVPAGKLIDMAGLKGLRIGGAEISRKHANFIINLGDAKESDVAAIIRKVRRIIKERFKVKLELELIDSGKLNMLF